VTAAREFEVALADGAYLLEEFQDFVAFHGASTARTSSAVSAGSLMSAGGSVKQTAMSGSGLAYASDTAWMGWLLGTQKVHRQECLCH
jgi:hypothetical protein